MDTKDLRNDLSFSLNVGADAKNVSFYWANRLTYIHCIIRTAIDHAFLIEEEGREYPALLSIVQRGRLVLLLLPFCRLRDRSKLIPSRFW